MNNSNLYKGTHKDVYLTTGFTATPRFGVEFGRKLTGDVIENKTRSARFVMPQYPIFRSYFGINNIFEWNYRFLPMRLSVSQDIFHLAHAETFGEVNGGAIVLRRVRGFHPYAKATLDIAFDPARRYMFSITYENGRAAPNFEYLNTIKTGLRVIY